MKQAILALTAFLFAWTLSAQTPKMSELKPDQLPKETSKWVSTNIQGGKVVRAGKIEEKGTLTYVAVVEAQGQKRVYLFDKSGNFSGKGDHLFQGKGQAGQTKGGNLKAPGTTDPPQGAPSTPKK